MRKYGSFCSLGCGNYSKVETIQGRKLFAEIRYAIFCNLGVSYELFFIKLRVLDDAQCTWFSFQILENISAFLQQYIID